MGPFAPRLAAELCQKIAVAVEHAHSKKVLHRDLKPGNILLDGSGEPHVSDFGLAKQFDRGSDLTGTGQILGTPSFMAPEQAKGKADFGPTTDIYSVGAILYNTITGRPPFQADTSIDTIASGRSPGAGFTATP